MEFKNIVQSTFAGTRGVISFPTEGIKFTTGDTTNEFSKENISKVGWVQSGKFCILELFLKPSGKFERFDGFRSHDYQKLKDVFREEFGLTLEQEKLSTYAINAGELVRDGPRKTLELRFESQRSLEVPFNRISQCAVPGKNEIEIQFRENEDALREDEQCVQIRFAVPPGDDGEDQSDALQSDIIERANIRGVTGTAIVTLEESICQFLTPRGKYRIEMHESSFRMHGKTYNYNIKYKKIARMFLLPNVYNTALVISLHDPIQQGQQRYPHLVMQVAKQQDSVLVNLTKEEIKEKYKGELKEVMEGDLPDIVAKLFKVMTKKKVYIPGDFSSYNDMKCVKCALKASQGLLYPLQRSFFFIHKPATFIRFDDIQSVEFQRYNALGKSNSASRSFDVEVVCRPVGGDSAQSYVFSNIDRNEYKPLFRFLSSKPLTIKNRKEAETDANGGAFGDEEDAFQRIDEDSDDSDFKDEGAPEESDSSEESDGDSDASDDGERSPKKKKKAAKKKRDPNAPKRPKSEYMIFSIEHSKKIREETPGISFGDVAKQVSTTWKSLAAEEKEKYTKLAEKDKARYEDEIKNYTPPEGFSSSGDPLSAKKAKRQGSAQKKRKRDPNAPKRPMTEYMFFSVEYSKKLREENEGMKFGEVSKIVSAKWKELTDPEKEKYKEMVKKDKERYANEMKNYTPPADIGESKKSKKKDKSSGATGKDDDDDDSSSSSSSSGSSSSSSSSSDSE